MTSPDPVDLVRTGYDAIADRYLAWSALIEDDPRFRLHRELLDRLAPGSQVVDLGCGAGLPSTQALASAGHDVLGIDVSPEQIHRARANVPQAAFRVADLSTLDLPAASVDAVTAFYSLIHVPRTLHSDLFHRIHGWLRPGGLVLATLSAGGSDGVEDDFLGVPMYFSGHGADANRELIAAAGFQTVLDEVVTIAEPGGAATFHWVLATR
jgi:ubiquinone/menaquinone biosynthesis C-methylase UbiE